jgi:dihydrofolate synthase/folylpolyglutamate synthase
VFNSAKEAIYWIEHIKRKEKRKDLSRIKYILNELSNPQLKYKTIHIAGTNGKGATACMLTNILLNEGYKVGRFVSPYILHFNERIVVNNNEIDDETLLRITNQIYPLIQKYNEKFDDVVPFFEVVTIIGFLYFCEQKVDYAVIECGLGGRLDATNCIESCVSIIPSIGYDHMKVLGDTLEEIAYHKLGIVKNNSHLITGVCDELHQLFIDYTKECNSTIEFINYHDLDIKSTFDNTTFKLDNSIYKTNLIGSFEALNAALAIKCAKYLINISDDSINKALSNIFWPGRLEILSKNPLLIMDGGHNISAIDVVVDSLNKIDSTKKYNIIYTGLSDKETDKVIAKLETIAKRFIITKIDDPRCQDIDILYNQVKMSDKIKIDNEFEALDYALSLKSDTLIIGSLHFVSSLRNYALSKMKK